MCNTTTTVKIVTATLALYWCFSSCTSEEQIKNASAQCTIPLGMEEGKIPDDAISASSSYETKSVGPQNARIRQEKNGGAWCPKAQISSGIREFLEIDLTRDHLITWTETQGRFGNGQGQEYAETFYLEYFRESKWHSYTTLAGESILRGNTNTYLVERQRLELPFVASRVRFVPWSQHPRTVCMRVEIYGCVWEQRVRVYKASRPATSGPGGANVDDNSYDGKLDINGDYLIDGMGQLVDGNLGEDPHSSSNLAHWVGWTNLHPITIVFEFTEIRQFENCTIYAANAPVRGIEVPKFIRISFSEDGDVYEPPTIDMDVEERSVYSPGIIPVSVPLRSRTSKFVKLEMEPRSKWLLLSEVTFTSISVLESNTSVESQDESLESSNYDRKNESLIYDGNYQQSPDMNYTDPEINANITPDAFPVSPQWSQTYIGLVSGALTVLALLLTCMVLLMKLRGRNKVALLQKHTALLCGTSAPGITINVKDMKLPTPIVVNGSQSSRLAGFAGSLKASKGRSGSVSSYDAATITREVIEGHQTPGQRDLNEYEHCSVYAEKTYKLLFPDERFSGCKTDYADVTEFNNETVALHMEQEKDQHAERTPQTLYTHKSKYSHGHSSKSKVYEGYYAATDILTIKRREQHTGSSLFTSYFIEERHNVEVQEIHHISRHRLRICDKIGEGSFGFVHLCEAKGIHSLDSGTMKNKQLVIVRSLWRGVTDSLKKDFMRDMCILAQIRDPNIARIVALVEEEPFGAVFEYGEHGDLPYYIRNQEKSNNEAPLSYSRLMKFITQIATGMKYLESLNIAHCDLAARNCVITKNLSIKVSDHAMYSSKYDGEYYVNECYAKIPLRWMAWEAVLLGKRSCQADIWSYATTVWEILTYCEDLPYSDMTSEQVLENCGKCYHSGTSEKPRILGQPSSCPRELYRMMTKCWNKHAESRPTFKDIYMFLKRINLD
ncbi:discoidin domain-containing receptor 2 [Diachasma alloeum]|uniref:discoidin domain-containing receptor 2 n=1 Tax=Diachasma alloeum TaxID=454923 RepID=UPI000738496E|nr:discoidin domain-containing receptor 2 [Diachasma alloeum]